MSNASPLPGNVPAGSISAAELDGSLPAGSVDPSEVGYTIRVPVWFPGLWDATGDAKGGGLAGLDQALDLTATEAAATYCKVADGVEYANLSAAGGLGGYAGNYQMFPTAPAAGDWIGFGAAVAFCEIALEFAQAATYNAAGVIEWYYNTSDALTIVNDGTGSTGQSGDYAFEQNGAITFVPPADWTATVIDSVTAYWIFAEIAAGKGANMTQVPITDTKEHLICTPTAGPRIPFDCTITAFRLIDYAATPHTAGDVKFVLMNVTKGTYCEELTFAQDRRSERFTLSTTIDCDAGDAFAAMVTQDDGANDPSDVVLELDVTPG